MDTRRLAAALCTAALGFMQSEPIEAELLAETPEFAVNEFTTGSQLGARARSIGRNRAGKVVLVWDSPQDGDDTGIVARRTDETGTAPVPGEILVNEYTTGPQDSAAVAVMSDGTFVVTWASFGPDGDGDGVFARRFASDGSPLGGDFQVNTYTTEGQSRPAIAAADDDSFVVVWQSVEQDGDREGIFGQRYDSGGVSAGTEFPVSAFTTDAQTDASIDMAGDGSFVVSWTSYGQDGDSPDSLGIVARRFDSGGNALADDMVVNTYVTADQRFSDVAVATDGSFTVVWASDGPDGDGDGVIARRYDALGVATGLEFVVNTFTAAGQTYPGVAGNRDGSFVVAWHSQQGGASEEVIARRYDASGSASGAEFQVNTYTTSIQGITNSVASDGFGRFAVVWADLVQDGSAFGLIGRLLCADDDNDGACDLTCGAAPLTGCRVGTLPGKSKLTIKDKDNDASDQIKWAWKKGEETLVTAYSDPTVAGPDYLMCVYDSSSAVQPIASVPILSGGTCGEAPCWKATGSKGFLYKDKDKLNALGGVQKVKLRSGDAGKAQIQIGAKGINVAPPPLPLTTTVTVQFLVFDGVTLECWESAFTTPDKNDDQTFSSKD